MKYFLNNKKGNLKGLIFLLGIILIISAIWYSQKLVDILKDKSTEYVHFRIRVFEANINNPQTNIDTEFFFNEVIKGADYPLIYTDTQGKPVSWVNISPEIDNKPWAEFSRKDSLLLFRHLKQMSEENNPIPIKFQDSTVLGYYHYGYSPVIYKLRLFPYIAIGAAALFILVGYLGFSYIKKSEEQFIWVGMAKETAHQLGTPLSSISGWLELLKMGGKNFELAFSEIQNDLKRLNKIATRFSKIGSVPQLHPVIVNQTITNVVSYFNKRLPNMQKKVSLETEMNYDVSVHINVDLFEWVLENLIKNALDAIENKTGKIRIRLKLNQDRTLAYIDVIDNGKGIPAQQRTAIFKPGFSTKKRGWGLGLSLARRIIEEYHGGKLILRESRPGLGATFRIQLKYN